MLQNLVSINSTASIPAGKGGMSSTEQKSSGEFGRTLNDVGASKNNGQSNGVAAGNAADGIGRTGQNGQESGRPVAGGPFAAKSTLKDKLTKEEHPTDVISDPGANPSSENEINMGLEINLPTVPVSMNGSFDQAAQQSALQSGDTLGAMSKNLSDASTTAAANGLLSNSWFGANGTAQLGADLSLGQVPGAALQASLGAAGLKPESRNPLDKLGTLSSKMGEALKEVGTAGSVGKEQTTLDAESLGKAAEENLQRSLADAKGNKDGEAALLGAKGAEASSIKTVNEVALGNLSSTSQTVITAVRENSNWSKMLSAPSVNFTETLKPNGKMLQALSVTLNPVELGKLELNLRMQQGQVTIDVRTESDQAYRALLVDQDTLVNNLRGLGFKVDGITINGPQSDNAAQFQNNSQTQDNRASTGFGGEASRGQDSDVEESVLSSNEISESDEENSVTHNII